MHITAQEEYGLRCLLRVAKHESGEPMRTQEVAQAEGLSLEYAAKLMRTLKNGGFVASTRGSAGGYLLARPARDVTVWQVLEALGGPLYEETFCDAHTGSQRDCTHATDCSIRALWRNVNGILKTALSAITLADLSRDEGATGAWLLRSATSSDAARRDGFAPSAQASALASGGDIASSLSRAAAQTPSSSPASRSDVGSASSAAMPALAAAAQREEALR